VYGPENASVGLALLIKIPANPADGFNARNTTIPVLGPPAERNIRDVDVMAVLFKVNDALAPAAKLVDTVVIIPDVPFKVTAVVIEVNWVTVPRVLVTTVASAFGSSKKNVLLAVALNHRF